MTLLRRLRPWGSQPGEFVRADMTRPEALQMKRLFDYGPSVDVDAVAGQRFPWSTPANVGYAIRSRGRVVSNTSGMRQIGALAEVIGDVDFSVRWVFEAASLSALQALFRNETGGDAVGLYIDGGAGVKVLKVYYRGVFISPTSVTGLVNGGLYDVVLTKTAGSQTCDLYINGVYESSPNAAGTGSNWFPQTWALWGDDFNQNVLGPKYRAQAWSRALSALDVARMYGALQTDSWWEALEPRNVWLPISDGGAGLSSDVTEAASATEATSATAGSAATTVEAATATEAAAAIAAMGAVLAESAAATEAVSSARASGSAVAEVTTAGDVTASSQATAAGTAEPAAATESASATAARVALMAEAATAGDAANWAGGALSASLSESASASDSTGATVTRAAAVAEVTTASDTAACTWSALAAITETSPAIDAATGEWITAAAAVEAGSALDIVDFELPSSDELFPLAGLIQTYPAAGQTQGFPLSGLAQTYPLGN